MNRFNRNNEPVALRKINKRNLHNIVYEDAYSWLKYIPANGNRTISKLPDEIKNHLLAESEYTNQQLDVISPVKEYFIKDLMAYEVITDTPPSSNNENWSYYSESTSSGAQFFRKNSRGTVQFLFDEAKRSSKSNYYRATDHQASLDNRYFIWAEDLIGNDRHQICVLDIKESTIKTIVKSDAYGYGGFVISPSSRYLFWIWRDKFNRPTKLYRTEIQSRKTELVYEENDPSLFMKIKRSETNSFIVLTLYGPTVSEIYLIHKDNESAAPKLLQSRTSGIQSEIYEWNGALVKLTNEDNSINNKIICMDYAGNFKNELVLHDPTTHIISIHPFEQALVRTIRNNGKLSLVLTHTNGHEITIDFKDDVYSIEVLSSQSFLNNKIRIKYQTPTTAPYWIDINLNNGEREIVGQTKVIGFDPKKYKSQLTYAVARDGATIPITLISSIKNSTSKLKPLLLTGYGAYGFANEAKFSLPVLSLVDAGFNYAIAHVRGGSEKGVDWYKAACEKNKHKSMTDFIDCAHHLIETKQADPEKIVAQGISAGGLLVCGAMNMEPNLWAGVIAQVPFVDMLNTMCDENHPLVPLLRPDWGDPISDVTAYEYIHSISPYENTKQTYYPPLLCTAGLKDDRVPYWEPAKLIANLRHHNLSDNPAILVLNPDSGHQESNDKQTEYAQAAMLWAFACECVGLKLVEQ